MGFYNGASVLRPTEKRLEENPRGNLQQVGIILSVSLREQFQVKKRKEAFRRNSASRAPIGSKNNIPWRNKFTRKVNDIPPFIVACDTAVRFVIFIYPIVSYYVRSLVREFRKTNSLFATCCTDRRIDRSSLR